jgi:hypothetical protein
MLSRSWGRVTGVLLFCLAAGTTASAQYGGGGTGTMGGTGTTGATSNGGYGPSSGKAIGLGRKRPLSAAPSR